jgi:hypothetical protein
MAAAVGANRCHRQPSEQESEMGEPRSAFLQQVVDTLVETKAVNLNAVGAIMSKFGDRAVREGESLVTIINRNVMWNCGWPGPELDIMKDQFKNQR